MKPALFLFAFATPVLELYQNGRFAEILEQLKNDQSVEGRRWVARVHWSARGPSLGDARTAREILLGLNDVDGLAEVEVVIDPARALVLGRQAGDKLVIAQALGKLGRRKESLAAAKEAERGADLRGWNALGRLYFELGDKESAGKCVEAGQPLAAQLIGRPRVSLTDLHEVANLDELYGDLLLSNRHLGHARGFYAKNRTRFRDWPWQSAYTVRRRQEAEKKLASIDRELLGAPTSPTRPGPRSPAPAH